METDVQWVGEPLVRYAVAPRREEAQRWMRVVRSVHAASTRRAGAEQARLVRGWVRAAACLRAPGLRAQAAQWLLEWRALTGRVTDEHVGAWPPDDRLRAQQLLVCVNVGLTPPVEAWRWLAGIKQDTAAANADAWRGVWQEFCAVARDARMGGALGVRREQLLCWLAGTPAAAVRRGLLVSWEHPAVRAFFRAAWERWKRSGREVASRVEDMWWQRVRAAFPRLRVERHVPLPESGMHLDIYWPRRGVALEIQGEPHWRAVERFGGGTALARRQERDARKRALCRALGITLFEVTADSPWEAVEARLRAVLRVRTGTAGGAGDRSA